MHVTQQDGGTCLQADFMLEILLENILAQSKLHR